MNAYWQDTIESAKEAGLKEAIGFEPLPIRENELSNAYAVEFEAYDGYPLFAYLHLPKSDGPHVPLFQAPGYGSVVAVPAFERRATYAVLALCHRGQRKSTSGFQAAYPGLLTHGLSDPEGYVWRDIVADCITAIRSFMRHPAVDASKLAVSGGDLAWLTSAFVPEVRTLQAAGLMFADLDARLATGPDYPLKELNDFRRVYPNDWETATQTLSNFDVMNLAGRITATKVMIACSESERGYYEAVSSKLSGETTIRINTGKGHVDHVAIEEWLADACGVQAGPAHYPRS